MGWASKDRLRKDLEQAEANTNAYIDSHLHICYNIGKPRHEHWQQGDDYCGDPSQEAQGLNSVFVVDKSTMKVVKEAIKNINKITK